MENRYDFLEYLEADASAAVLACLDDLVDIVRASSVSHAWRRFIIAKGFSKSLCLRMFSEVSNLTSIVEVRNSTDDLVLPRGSSTDWESLLREHRIYTSLIRRITSRESRRDIMLVPVCASSTDNFPDESIDNTLEPYDQVDTAPSYWSSAGSNDPNASETLTYRLSSRLCVVHEIKLQPFQAYFQYGNPIYSAKAVRFRMGHPKFSLNGLDMKITGDKFCRKQEDYTWTYVSPVFRMNQVNALQLFNLPRPVLCIGGVLQIELMGRVQRQEMDNLFYICVSHVKVIGNPLFPEFDVDLVNAAGEAVLRYYPEGGGGSSGSSSSSSGEEAVASTESEAERFTGWQAFAERLRQMRAGGAWNRALLNALLGNVPVEDGNTDEDELF